MTEEVDYLTLEVSCADWVVSIVEWAGLAKVYQEKTNYMAGIISEHFATPSAYRFNHNAIKRAILEGFSQEDKDIILLTNSFLREKARDDNKKELMKKRQSIQTKISQLFNNLGVATYKDVYKRGDFGTPEGCIKTVGGSTKKERKPQIQKDDVSELTEKESVSVGVESTNVINSEFKEELPKQE